jgi:hypothetical protein
LLVLRREGFDTADGTRLRTVLERISGLAMSDTLDSFKARLNAHDWFFYMSDDRSVVERGERNQQALHREAKNYGIEGLQAYADKYAEMQKKAGF